MSLRLRDGPRGKNRRPLINDRRSSKASVTDDDSSTLFTNKGNLDGILNSVLRPTTTTPSSPTEKRDDMDMWTIQDELKSQADESTAMSSVNWAPLQTPAQIRATAPRAVLSQKPPAAAAPVLSQTAKNNDEEDVITLGTIDQNRPIDQVFVYSSTSASGAPRFSSLPAQSSSFSHRQRRQYRSGNRNVASASSSIGTHSTAFTASSGVGSILDRLGLNSVSEYSGSSTSSSKKKSYSSSLGSTTQGAIYARTGLVLLLLMSILYLQWSAIEQQQQPEEYNSQHRHRYFRHKSSVALEDGHEEGVDRPVYNAKVLGNMHAHDPNKVALQMAKVETKRQGPEHVMDQPHYVVPEVVQVPETVQVPEVDALPEYTENEDLDVITISPEIQTGFAGTYTKDSKNDNIPFLWYIPRSGGGMIRNICSQCLGLTLASEVGGTLPKPPGEKTLAVVSVGNYKYVNVDTSTVEGIAEAKALGLASSGMAQLVISPRIREGAALFDSRKGRAFAFLRNPVERAVSMFYFLQKHNVPSIAKMTLEEYAKSPHVENNWMVRMLSGKMEGEVGEKELAIAKEVLRTKVVVGLMEWKEESIQRFAWYFHLPSVQGKQAQCQTRILTGDFRTNESAKGKIKEGSQAWTLILWQNKLDMKLYKYAKALYLQQGAELFAEMPQNK